MARGTPLAAAAMLAQADAIGEWVDGLSEDDYDRPSVLAGWRVAELVAHLGLMLQAVVDVAGKSSGQRPRSIAGYLAGYPAAAEAIRDRELAAARGRAGRQLAATYAQGRDAVRRLLDGPPDAATTAARSGSSGPPAPPGDLGGTPDAATTHGRDAVRRRIDRPPDPAGTVLGGPGPIRWNDYLVTRVIELVVHADDLARSLPDREPLALDRQALRVATVALARALAERAPGQSVELRVPPYAAVQCVEGPRHSRGTPPNVVETDPLTWVRLAAGRLGWTEAVAGPFVRASGPRANLAPWLPIL